MFKKCVIAAAITFTVTLAGPGGSAQADTPCSDYFDCGYTLPEHLIIGPAIGTRASGKYVPEPPPFNQGPPIYNDWQPSEGAE